MTQNVIPEGEIVLTGDGTHPISEGVPQGTEYDFIVKTQPENKICTFNGESSGTIESSLIALELTCVPSNEKLFFSCVSWDCQFFSIPLQHLQQKFIFS